MAMPRESDKLKLGKGSAFVKSRLKYLRQEDDAWEADFFAPAKALLAAAPWIVVRGNHESCNRAGQGWWRFLDPRPLEARRSCDDPAHDAIGDFSPSYAVPLGAGAAADTQFVVFDSSAVGLAPLAPTDPVYRNYHAQFEQAFALAARRPNNFFVLHHPVILVLAYFVVQWNVGLLPKLLVVTFGASAISLALYEYGIRRLRPLRFMFGMRA